MLEGVIKEASFSRLRYYEVESKYWLENAQKLTERGYRYPAMLTAYDSGNGIEVMAFFYNLENGEGVVMATEVEYFSKLLSLSSVIRGFEWHENETYEMFGVEFEGHPDYERWGKIRRLLTSEDPRLWPQDRFPLLKSSKGYKDLPKVDWATIRGTDMIDRKKLMEGLTYVHIGPQHPATHGPVAFLLGLRGEVVEDVIPLIGYVHRGVEWILERKTYTQVIPLLDRQCYVDAIGWEIPYVLAIEELMGVKPDPRAQYLRVVAAELSRMASHVLYLGSFLENVNHLTGFAWTVRDREVLLNLLEMLTGQRMTFNYVKPGGVTRDLPQGFRELVERVFIKLEKRLDDLYKITFHNPTVLMRAEGVARVSAEKAIEMGWAGPNLRGSGVKWDLRLNKPYLVYDELEFEGAIGKEGDILDRMLVRLEEIYQSMRIIRQALKRLSVSGDLGTHYKRVPPFPRKEGVAYGVHEAARGESGVLVVTKPKKNIRNPWRVHMRSPVFVHTMSLKYLGRGMLLQDFLAFYISLDTCVAEMDR